MSTRTRTSSRLALAGGVGAGLLGATMLAVWISDAAALERVRPLVYAMKANTALGFVLVGVALSVGATAAANSLAGRRIMQGCAALAVLIGLLNLVDYLFGWRPDVDRLVLRYAPGSASTSALGRMAPTTAVNFVLVGAALMWEAGRRDPRAAQALAFAVALVSFVPLIGYAYDFEALYGTTSYTRMAVHSALAFCAVAGGLLLLRPDEGVMAVVTSDSAGGIMARRLLPATIVVPVMLGWLRIGGQRAGLYGDAVGLAALVVCNVTVLAAVVAWTAGSLHRTDRARKRALDALGVSEGRYRQLTEASLDAIVVADADGRIVHFNRAAERTFGYPAAAVLGRPLTVLMPPAFHAAHEHGLRRFVETREARLVGRTVEITGRRQDGTDFPVELSLAAVEGAGDVQFIGSIRDLTERHHMRNVMIQTEKLASIGLLSAGIAHEINNPLAYVANNLAVLARDTQGLLSLLDAYGGTHDRLAQADPAGAARVRELSEQIDLPYLRTNLERVLGTTREGVDRVARIVQAMRGMARSGPPRMEMVSLSDLVETSLELVRGRIARRGIAVELDCKATPSVRCAASQLSQVLLNLVVNAVQAVEAAGQTTAATIRIGSRVVGEDIVIEVQDNGCGIPEDQLQRIFDPFFTTKDVGEGTGLGLSISHSIVTAHGGRIEASSRPGEGTSVRVVLPQHDPGGAA